MNFKTTLTLAVALAVLGVAYLWKPRPDSAPSAAASARPMNLSPASRKLIEQELGDIVKIQCNLADGDEWIFEKGDDAEEVADADWRMTSPSDMKVVTWDVDRIGRRIADLKYEMSYQPGQAGAVTVAQAGLDPPKVTVTLTDVDGQTAAVEIGKDASLSETFVRMAGSDTICVATTSLGSLIKTKAIDYRDKALWSFADKDVTHVEIVDRADSTKPVTYTFARDGARWMMASPVSAQATSRVDDMLRTMSRLRAITWHDDNPERLAAYGFSPAMLTVRVTVEEEIELADEEEPDEAGEADEGPKEEKPEAEPQIKRTTYELHVSQRSPIGESTKRYVRIGDEPAVGSILKTAADKFKPVMSKWREMRLTTENVSGATRLELQTTEGSAAFAKESGTWTYTDTGDAAEDQAVDELIKAIADLSAVVFVDGEPTDLSSFGLDAPRAMIRLTVPGLEQSERIAVGAFTDPNSKRLVYVRRNEVASVAKVRATDVAVLLRGPRTYRDRTVLDLSASRVQRISLVTDRRPADGQTNVTFSRQGDVWRLSSPIDAPVREVKLNKLVESLCTLQADAVVAEEGEMSAFGLHAPTATVSITSRLPSSFRLESAEETGDAEEIGDAEESDGAEPSGETTESDEGRVTAVEIQPPDQNVKLLFAEHDGVIFAKRLDRPAIYRVPSSIYEQLFQEYRSDEVFDLDDTAVRELSIRRGEELHVFRRTDDGWKYQPEPDLPLDAKKVDDLLLRVLDLKSERFVDHAASPSASFDLADPMHEVTVTLEDGTKHVLTVAATPCEGCSGKGHYSAMRDRPGVFLMTPSTLNRFAVSLSDLEAAP